MTRTLLLGVLVAACLLTVPASGHAGTPPAAGALGTAAADGGTQSAVLTVSYRIERMPAEPGRVSVEANISVPAAVESVGFTAPATTTVTGSDGFREAGARDYELQSGRSTATVRFTVGVNETRSDGRYEMVDTGDWALFDWREATLDWRYVGDGVRVTESATVAGPGVAGVGYAFAGPTDRYRKTVAGERLELVVPSSATMAVMPETVLDQLTVAARNLPLGAENDRVRIFVAPDPIETRGREITVSSAAESDLLVTEDAHVRTPDNAWVHEYVHSRQEYRQRPSMAWLDDATAEYYGAFVPLQTGAITFEQFYRYVTKTRGPAVTLTDPDHRTAAYFRGMRTIAALEAELAGRTDGAASVATVLRRLNEHEGTVTVRTFRNAIAATAGPGFNASDWTRRYVRGTERPPVPHDESIYTIGIDAQASGPLDWLTLRLDGNLLGTFAFVCGLVLVAVPAGAWLRSRRRGRP